MMLDEKDGYAAAVTDSEYLAAQPIDLFVIEAAGRFIEEQ